MNQVRILGFVNHIPPGPGIEESIERAFAWGVDVVVAQGTGSDWGPYWLGSGEQVAANQAANVRPYVRAALRHKVPFVFSFGIAGANVHLDQCLAQFDALCAAEGWNLSVGVVRSELSADVLVSAIEAGSTIPPATAGAGLAAPLTTEEVRRAERIVALIGPEPVIAALDAGVDGVITGRALDIGLFMALPMLRGLPTAVAAHAGKLLECGGLALSPGDSGQCIWASLDEDGFEVRSPNPHYLADVRSLVSHTFYERAHPTLEENPGGCLDLSHARYAETDRGVRCTGARWIERPYTVLVEGARREGFRAIAMLGVREPALLGQIREWTDRAERTLRDSERFAAAIESGRLRVSTRIFGLDGVLGPVEPEKQVTGHEAAVVLDVVADERALAEEAAYFGFIRLFIGPYPGRKTTAGNAAAPFMPVVIPVSDVYAFSIYHLLPLPDPVEPFPVTVEAFPRTGTVDAFSRNQGVARAAGAGSGGGKRGLSMQLYESAAIIRSKNAGPFTVTIDIFFDDPARYEEARASQLLTAGGVARAYGVPEDTIKGIYWDERVLGAKVSLLRWSSSTDPFCADLFGAHLHTPLALAELSR